MKTKTLLASCVVAAAVSLVAADWPQWQGPDRTNVSQETGLLEKWPEKGPKLLWTFTDAGVGYAGPAIVGDRLYTMGADETKEYIFAIDLKTRKKLWSSEIGPLFVNPWCDGPRSTPTVDGDLVFALGGQGNLICVKADNGATVWRKQFKQELAGAQMSGWGYTESPLVDGDQVVATPGGDKGAIAAFNKKSGSLLWRSQAYTDKAGYSSLVLGEVGGIRQYVQRTGNSVAGVAAKDGRLLWRFSHTAPTAAIPTPVVADNYVFSTSGYGAGCVLIQLTPKGQEIKADEVYANKDMSNHHGGVVKVGDYIYGHSDKGGWMCMEFKTGKVLWKETRKLGKGSITCADGHLYCFSENDGTVALIEASPDGWKESGRFKLPQQTMLSRKRGKIWTHPVVADGRLYLRDQDLIFCYDISGH